MAQTHCVHYSCELSELTNSSSSICTVRAFCHDLIGELFSNATHTSSLVRDLGTRHTHHIFFCLSLSFFFLIKDAFIASCTVIYAVQRGASGFIALPPIATPGLCTAVDHRDPLCAPSRLLPLTHTAHHSCLISGGGARRVAFTAAGQLLNRKTFLA